MIYIAMILCAVLVVYWVLKEILYLFDGKCEFFKVCKLYNIDSNTCNKTRGVYYDNRYPGCYRKLKGWQ